MELWRGGSKLNNMHEGATGRNAGAFPLCALLMNDEGGLQGWICSKST